MHSVAEHRRTTVRSCHHSGKTWAASVLVHWWLRCFDPSLVITTAPTERQVKDVLWSEVRLRFGQARLPGVLNTGDLTISPTQRAFGFTTNQPEKFQGWHSPNILVIVDEASGVEEPIYQAIEGILTGPNAKLLLIGNPNNALGTFFESFRSPHLYMPFHIQASDVPGWLLPPSWAEERRLDWGEESPLYQVRVLGNFPEQAEDALISLKWAEAAQQREGESGDGAPIQCGVDVARFGGDESVAYVRQASRVVDARAWRSQDTMASAGRVAALCAAWHPQVVAVDEIGLGAGVLDRLVSDGLPARGINVGEKARDSEKFYDRRSELYWALRERFRSGDISIPQDDSMLLDQLTQLRFSYTPRGQIRLESKDDMRKRRPPGTRWQSPDRADALMLAFATAGNRWTPISMVGNTREA